MKSISKSGGRQHVGQCLRMLKMARAPTMLGLIVGSLFLTGPDGSLAGDEYYHSEAFAGAGRVTQEFLDAGLPALAMDIKYGAQWDVNSNVGFVNTLKTFLQTSIASTLAPVCSSFTHVNSGTARRSFATPLGRTSQPSVQYANKMANRCIICLHLLYSLGILFLLEQPKGSWLETLPRFQEFIKEKKIYRKLIYMKDYFCGLSLNAVKWLYISVCLFVQQHRTHVRYIHTFRLTFRPRFTKSMNPCILGKWIGVLGICIEDLEDVYSSGGGGAPPPGPLLYLDTLWIEILWGS